MKNHHHHHRQNTWFRRIDAAVIHVMYYLSIAAGTETPPSRTAEEELAESNGISVALSVIEIPLFVRGPTILHWSSGTCLITLAVEQFYTDRVGPRLLPVLPTSQVLHWSHSRPTCWTRKVVTPSRTVPRSRPSEYADRVSCISKVHARLWYPFRITKCWVGSIKINYKVLFGKFLKIIFI